MVNQEYMEINPALWRRGQPWQYTDKKYIIRRSGAGMFLTFGIVEDAFSTGFTMRKRNAPTRTKTTDETDETELADGVDGASLDNNNGNDKPISQPRSLSQATTKESGNGSQLPKKTKDDAIHPRNDEIIQSDEYNGHMYALKRAIGHKRSFEWSAIIVQKTEDKRKIVNWGDRSNTKLYWKDDGVTLHRVEYSPVKGNRYNPVNSDPYIFGIKEDGTKGESLDNVRVIMNRDIKFGEGIADIDPYLDSLFTLACIFEFIGLWAIRTVGVPILKAEESLWEADNDDLKTEVQDNMRNYGVNTKLMIPKTIKGVETDFEIYSPASTPNFDVAINGILAEISMGTGIPREKLLGNPVGLRSSDENTINWFRAIQKIQDEHIQDFEWLYRNIWEIADEDDFYLEVDPFKVLDETRVIELKKAKLEALMSLQSPEKYGISPQALLEYLDIEIDVDESIIAKFEETREAFMNSTANNGVDNERADNQATAKNSSNSKDRFRQSRLETDQS